MTANVTSLWRYRYVRDYRACNTLDDLSQLRDQDLFDWEPELADEWTRCHDRLAARELLASGGAE